MDGFKAEKHGFGPERKQDPNSARHKRNQRTFREYLAHDPPTFGSHS